VAALEAGSLSGGQNCRHPPEFGPAVRFFWSREESGWPRSPACATASTPTSS